VRKSALDLLARREHSTQELRRKLASRNFEPELVESTVTALVSEGLLDNARFAESFVHSRYQRGQGPQKIRSELRERGVDDGLIAECLDDTSLHWSERVEQVRKKRFGPKPPTDFRERSRQMRFLLQRGFTSEQIQGVFSRSG
jgi:regulatory protein